MLKATTTTTPAELQQRWETAVAEVLRKAEQAERKARGKRLTWLRQEQQKWARLADRPPERATAGGAARHAHVHIGQLGNCVTWLSFGPDVDFFRSAPLF